MNIFKKIFKRSLKKEPMYYETGSYAELSEFYNEEANKCAQSASAKLKKDLHDELKRLTARREHDEKVLDYRKMRIEKKTTKVKEKEVANLKPFKSIDKQDKQDKPVSTALVPKPINAPVAVIEPDDDDLPEE